MKNLQFKSAEFDARIDASGQIHVPENIARTFRERRGAVHVRLTTESLNNALERHGVTEAEIERIISVQRESWGQAVKFLLSEGALRGSRLTRRIL